MPISKAAKSPPTRDSFRFANSTIVSDSLPPSPRPSAIAARPGKVEHSRRGIFRHRVYGLIAGYEDARDADSTRHDPLFQAVADDRGAGDLLASQSTITRWENGVTEEEIEDLYRTIRRQYLIARPRAPKRLILDADASGGVCHGHQQLTFFNAFYDERIYKPLYLFDGDWGYPLAGALPPGNEGDASRCLIYLDEVLTDLRRKWRRTQYVFRADSNLSSSWPYRELFTTIYNKILALPPPATT